MFISNAVFVSRLIYILFSTSLALCSCLCRFSRWIQQISSIFSKQSLATVYPVIAVITYLLVLSEPCRPHSACSCLLLRKTPDPYSTLNHISPLQNKRQPFQNKELMSSQCLIGLQKHGGQDWTMQTGGEVRGAFVFLCLSVKKKKKTRKRAASLMKMMREDESEPQMINRWLKLWERRTDAWNYHRAPE